MDKQSMPFNERWSAFALAVNQLSAEWGVDFQPSLMPMDKWAVPVGAPVTPAPESAGEPVPSPIQNPESPEATA